MSGLMPVPVRGTLAVGVSRSLELMVSDADLAPTDGGAKVTFTVQFEPAMIVGARLGQGFIPPVTTLNMAALAPEVAIEVTTRFAVPVFEMVTCWAADV